MVEFGGPICGRFGLPTGRAVHPMADTIGGFRRLPSVSRLAGLEKKADKLMKKAVVFSDLFVNLPYPKFHRKTEYIALAPGQKKYNILFGDKLISSDLGKINLADFEQEITEQRDYGEKVKRVHHHGKTYMLGAIARMNLNQKYLNKLKSYWRNNWI